ncbi:hypothetical protein GIB67_009283 [Kingdonia uniflora]|uniref:Myb/SANT-like domain-containing protein n=1 Tax=Kingdonia uniflora TaxID=39325 RepID=A0A7J7N2W9_9MAGN|nr:hypothetical protein GIB67_009283 [Kingdonia uniflora]
MPFSRDYSHFSFDPFKDLRFMEKAQYEIDTYGTERDNFLKLSLLRNIREKCLQEFQRDVTHKDLRNRWDYLKNKYKIWETLKQLAGEGYDEVTGTFNLTEHRMIIFDSRTWVNRSILIKEDRMKAIKACTDFKSKYLDIEFVPEKEFSVMRLKRLKQLRWNKPVVVKVELDRLVIVKVELEDNVFPDMEIDESIPVDLPNVHLCPSVHALNPSFL